MEKPTLKFKILQFSSIFVLVSIQQIASELVRPPATFFKNIFNKSLTREFRNNSRCCKWGETMVELEARLENYTCQRPQTMNNETNIEINDKKSPRGFPNCSYKIVINDKHKIFHISDDGIAKVGFQVLLDFIHPVWLPVKNGEYCADHYVKNSNANNDTYIAALDELNILLYCDIENWDNFILYLHINGVIKLIQGSIALITMTPYLLLWDSQNASGWTQCSCFLAVGLDCLFTGIYSFVYENQLALVPAYLCTFSAAILQIVEMALYCTWAICCYDMLRIVWSCKCPKKSSMEYLRLSIYMFIGWGIPCVTVTSGVLWGASYYPNDYIDEYIRCPPPITESTQVTVIQIVFFIATTILYVIMMIVIWKHSKDVQLASKSINKRYGKSVNLFLKLTLMMGCPYLIITALEITIGENLGNSWILACLRSILLITVLILFKLFACNKRNLKKLKQKYKILQFM